MGWSLEPDEHWQWQWSVYNSAYGLVMGRADTAHQASVRMLLAEYELFETPLPKSVAALMLATPQEHTKFLCDDCAVGLCAHKSNEV